MLYSSSEFRNLVVDLLNPLLQAKPVARYTKPLLGPQRGNQGWTLEGRNRFAQVCRMVKEDRRVRGADFDKVLARYIVKKHSDRLGTKKKGQGLDDGEEEEDFFDEMQFVSAKGEYCPDRASSSDGGGGDGGAVMQVAEDEEKEEVFGSQAVEI